MQRIYPNIDEPQDRRLGHIVMRPPRTSSIFVRAASTPARAAFSVSLPVSIASIRVVMQGERVQMIKQQRLFEDVVLDAYPAHSEQNEEPPPETPPSVE